MKESSCFCPLTRVLYFCLGLLTMLSSCKDYEDIDPVLPNRYTYSLSVFHGTDEKILVLDSITSPIKSIGDCPDWAVVTISDEEHEGHPVVLIKVDDKTPDTIESAEVMLKAQNGDIVILKLNQGYTLDTYNPGVDPDFLVNWENHKTVNIYGLSAPQNTPWNKDCVSTLPQNVRYDVRKADGWEMAFCSLNDPSKQDANYFGLYNKYTGILRVFYYVNKVNHNASRYSIEVGFGDQNAAKGMEPYFHTLAFGIPSKHPTFRSNMDLIGAGNGRTFRSFYTTYRQNSSTAMSVGWTGFDIPLSAYNVKGGADWRNGNYDALSFSGMSETLNKIDLNGVIKGNISGKLNLPDFQAASATTGLGSIFRGIGSALEDVDTFVLFAIEEALTNNQSCLGSFYAGMVFDMAASVVDGIYSPVQPHKADSLTGKFDASLTGDINMKGYISGLTPSDITALNMSTASVNPKSHIGDGVWNLVENPVIYISDDCIVGDAVHLNMAVFENNDVKTYGNTAVADNNVRMVSFLDPNSIKLQLNRDVFNENLDSVNVICSYGVYPKDSAGHTSKYANLLKLERREMKIVKDDEDCKYYRSDEPDKQQTRYYRVRKEWIMSDYLGENKDNCKLVKQAGADYQYYGHPVDVDGKTVIMSPQVLFPYKDVDKAPRMMNGQVPDFVVTVQVSFKSNGRKHVFIKRFIPEVKLVNYDIIKERYDKLIEYSDKCRNSLPVNTLDNDPTIPVYHKNGDKLIKKTLDLLHEIID